MSETVEQIERRMRSGEPFTFQDLWGPVAQGNHNHPAYRLADRTIQRYRKNGWIKIDGRKGRSPLWRFMPECYPAPPPNHMREQ